MDNLEGKTVEYPYHLRIGKEWFSHTTVEQPHIILPDYRYVPERLIIKPYTRSQKEAMMFNVKH